MPEAFAVLRKNATERAFSHPYHAPSPHGIHRCAGCGRPVCEATHKFHSDSGWLAFDRAIGGRVRKGPDPLPGILLTEVHCATCGGHLGHIFNDGPDEKTAKRQCIDGVAPSFRTAET